MKKNKKPVLIIVCGYLGVGKTTIARKLASMLGTPAASIDEILKRVFPKPSNIGKDLPFSKEEIRINYQIFAFLAEYMLSAKNSIILDGSFAKTWQRKLVISIAKKLRAPYFILYVTCPEKIIKKRASSRYRKGRGVGWQAYLRYKKEFKPLRNPHFIIDTSSPIEVQLKSFLEKYNL